MTRGNFSVPSRRAAGLAAIVALLGGCSVLEEISEGRREYEAGWRTGVVSKVGSAAALPAGEHRAIGCRASEPVASAQQPYALVKYGKRDSRRSRIVPVPDGMSYAPGNLVRVNVKRCDDAIRPRDER